MPSHDEAGILHSWHRNADAWTRSVRDRRIESRNLVTDQAILDAIFALRPRSVLDVGCGEGGLVHALTACGIQAMGVDAVPALIARASEAGGHFEVASYEDIAAGSLSRRFHAVVCNFSLLGDVSVPRLLAALPALLEEDGRLIVQTVHPLIACGEHAYVDGWRVETWAGFDATFPAPAPWYFRTLSSWISLFAAGGWQLCDLREPLHPHTGRPASAIFIAKR